MAWYNDVVGAVGKGVTKYALPAVADYGGAVVGGAVGTVVGGPAGTVAGAAAGNLAAQGIKKAAGYGVKKGVHAVNKPKKRRKHTRRKVARVATAAPAPSRRTSRNVRKVAIVFTVDGDGNVRKKKTMRLVKRSVSRRLRRAASGKVPAMVVPSGSQKGDALATAGRLIASIQSADPKLAAYAKAVMNATAARARKGDPAAKRAVSFLKAAQSANKSKGRLTGFLVTNSGRVVIGSFIQTG